MTFILSLNDEQIISRFERITTRERKLQSLFLQYLVEVHRRKLFAQAGYSSLCMYLVKVFNYSEESALKRIQVARCAEKYPIILKLVEEGRLSLTALMKLAPHLNGTNIDRLLMSCERKSVREVESILAGEFPRPEPRDQIKPLSEDRVHFSFSADKEFQALVEQAKALLSNKYPEARLKDVFKEALEVLIEGAPKDILKNSSHIPREVKEIVWKRDQGKCSFVARDGTSCETRRFLEFDHIMPRALEGRSDDPTNIRLLCRTHNLLMAHEVFGREFIEKKIRENSNTIQAEGDMNQFRLGYWMAGSFENYKRLINEGRQ